MTLTARSEFGIAIMAGAMLVSPSLDILAKLLVEHYPPIQIALARFAGQAVFFAVLLLLYRSHFAKPSLTHVVAGIMIACSWLLLVASFSFMQVATALTIFFVEPLLLILLSYLMLREPLDFESVVAVVIGLVGAIIVIRPNFTNFGMAAFMPLASAACFALYLALNKRMAAIQGHLQIQFWIGCSATIFFGVVILIAPISGIAVPRFNAVASGADLALFLAIGFLGCAVHLCVAWALKIARASILAPFQYLEIIGATVLGLLVFGSWPDYPTLAGAVIIVGAGIYSFDSERRRAKAALT